MTTDRGTERTRWLIIDACAMAAMIGPIGSAALAQDTDRVTIDARRCLELESADERLACFESQVENARGEPPDDASPSPAPRAAEPVRTVDLGGGPQRRTDDAENEIVGKITALAEREPNQYLITLDNGDVWLQQIATRYQMRVGQRVRIYATQWGSNRRLQADGANGFIQVKRVAP